MAVMEPGKVTSFDRLRVEGTWFEWTFRFLNSDAEYIFTDMSNMGAAGYNISYREYKGPQSYNLTCDASAMLYQPVMLIRQVETF